MTTIQSIQTLLGVTPDGLWGPKSQAALDALIHAPASGEHLVRASSFADPADVQAFRRCKARGKSDRECFKVGDNGIGKWGDDTTAPRPMCALPPEDWAPLGAEARGAKVRVRANGRETICELRDTMPHRANIKNGAGIDLNPAACAALGLTPPIMVAATWEWA
jgi:hypothetical protein